ATVQGQGILMMPWASSNLAVVQLWEMKIAGQTNEALHPVRVLVVDDDPAIIEMLAVGLGYEGIEVYSASTGLAALEQFDAHKPDVVLLGTGLPDIDGMEILRRLRTSG